MATLTRAESLAILSGGAKGKGTPALEQDEEKRRSSQNSGGAVMSREESLKILSEGAAGTYKPKNETADSSSFTSKSGKFDASAAAPTADYTQQRAKLQKELDRLDNAAAYVTTTEQSDEIDAQRKPIIEQLRKLDEAEGKTGIYTGGDRLKNALGNAKLATQQGLTQADHRIAQTADWFFGGIAKEGKALVNATLQTINPNWGFEDEDPWITRYNKRGTEVLAQNDAVAQRRIEEGKLNATAWKYAPEVVAAIPDAVLAFATGGASTGAQATRAGLETASAIAQGSSAAQKLIPIAGAAKNMMKSPAWMSAFAQSAGGSYKEALADGATEEQANLYALLNGFANATIEVGGSDEAMGGIQKLPQQLRDALEKGNKNAVMQWVKSTAGEAKEEVLQGMAEKGLRGLYTNDVPLYSATDENAVINPKRAKEEALGGLIVGGVLGGGQTALQSAINSGRVQNPTPAQTAQEAQNVQRDIPAAPKTENVRTADSGALNAALETIGAVTRTGGSTESAMKLLSPKQIEAYNDYLAEKNAAEETEFQRKKSEEQKAQGQKAEQVQTDEAKSEKPVAKTNGEQYNKFTFDYKAANEEANAAYDAEVKKWYEQHPDAQNIDPESPLYDRNAFVNQRVREMNREAFIKYRQEAQKTQTEDDLTDEIEWDEENVPDMEENHHQETRQDDYRRDDEAYKDNVDEDWDTNSRRTDISGNKVDAHGTRSISRGTFRSDAEAPPVTAAERRYAKLMGEERADSIEKREAARAAVTENATERMERMAAENKLLREIIAAKTPEERAAAQAKYKKLSDSAESEQNIAKGGNENVHDLRETHEAGQGERGTRTEVVGGAPGRTGGSGTLLHGNLAEATRGASRADFKQRAEEAGYKVIPESEYLPDEIEAANIIKKVFGDKADVYVFPAVHEFALALHTHLKDGATVFSFARNRGGEKTSLSTIVLHELGHAFIPPEITDNTKHYIGAVMR